MLPDSPRPPGRPRSSRIDAAVLAAAEHQLGLRGYGGMSLESVAAAARTSVPSVRRRFHTKLELVSAVIDSLRVEPLPEPTEAPRDDALAILENFERNLRRPNVLSMLGSLLAEEERYPQLIDLFRRRLARPRRARLHETLARGVHAGELPAALNLDAAANMLIGGFYARHILSGDIPEGWASTVLRVVWPETR